jgi:hypothetical protein
MQTKTKTKTIARFVKKDSPFFFSAENSCLRQQTYLKKEDVVLNYMCFFTLMAS